MGDDIQKRISSSHSGLPTLPPRLDSQNEPALFDVRDILSVTFGSKMRRELSADKIIHFLKIGPETNRECRV